MPRESFETSGIPELVPPPLRSSIHLFHDSPRDSCSTCDLKPPERIKPDGPKPQEGMMSEDFFEKPEQDHECRSCRLPVLIRLRGSRRLVVALYGCLVQEILITSSEFLLPIRAKYLFAWGPTGAGVIFLPLTIPGLVIPS